MHCDHEILIAERESLRITSKIQKFLFLILMKFLFLGISHFMKLSLICLKLGFIFLMRECTCSWPEISCLRFCLGVMYSLYNALLYPFEQPRGSFLLSWPEKLELLVRSICFNQANNQSINESSVHRTAHQPWIKPHWLWHWSKQKIRQIGVN